MKSMSLIPTPYYGSVNIGLSHLFKNNGSDLSYHFRAALYNKYAYGKYEPLYPIRRYDADKIQLYAKYP